MIKHLYSSTCNSTKKQRERYGGLLRVMIKRMLFHDPNRGRMGPWGYRINPDGFIDIRDRFEGTGRKAASGKNDNEAHDQTRTVWFRGTTHDLGDMIYRGLVKMSLYIFVKRKTFENRDVDKVTKCKKHPRTPYLEENRATWHFSQNGTSWESGKCSTTKMHSGVVFGIGRGWTSRRHLRPVGL